MCCTDGGEARPEDTLDIRRIPAIPYADSPGPLKLDGPPCEPCLLDPCLHGGGLACFEPQDRHVGLHPLTSIPEKPDRRDHVADFSATSTLMPGEVNLSSSQDLVMENHGSLGSCVASAICALFHFDLKKQIEQFADFVPSVLFVNYNLRFMDTPNLNITATSLRDGLKSLKVWGMCPEPMWPYSVYKLNMKPPQACYRAAKNFRLLRYQAVQQTLPQLKACLAWGQAFVFGFIVHSSFHGYDVEKRGQMRMPRAKNDPVEGGHAVCAVGYDDSKSVFIVRNSWGPDWGDSGHFYMPYDYITDPRLCYDFWTASWVPDAQRPPCPDGTCPQM